MSFFNFNGQNISCDTSEFYEGNNLVLTVDGKTIRRKVYFCKDGLYVTINGYKVFYEDFKDGE
ncbi:MAG: hypothetical protein MJ181_10750 [Treponema sp.]|nr:hypothetical protein [Treponema sp.]